MLNGCIFSRKRTKNYKSYFYCTTQKKIILSTDCKNCPLKEYKEIKQINYNKKTIKTNTKQSKRAKACDIKNGVPNAVFKRDKGRCVVCGNSVNVMPNSHYISRSKGGLGIEENIVTMCTEFTENKCHHKYDNCTDKKEKQIMKNNIKKYLMSIYPDWDEDKLIYRKGV